jgi:lipopolysaccharide export system permease protein
VVLGLLNRSIFWELVRVFVLALIGLTGLFLVGGLIQAAAQMGLSASQLVVITPYLIPYSLPFTIPATTLFATCVVYGRLSNDNEAVAVKAAGIDLLTLLRPALLLGVINTGVTAWLSYSLIPRTQQWIQMEVLKDPEEVLYNRLRRDRALRSASSPYGVYIRDVQGRRLIDVVVKKWKWDGVNARTDYDYVARFREARLIVDLDRGKMAIDGDRFVAAGDVSRIDSAGGQRIDVDLPPEFSPSTIKAKPMALEWDELLPRRDVLVAEQRSWEAKRQENLDAAARESDPGQRAAMMLREPHFEAQIKEAKRQVRNVDYELHIRPALAVGCVCFALIGCPVGLWLNRSDYLSTFVICFLPTVFVYYPLLLSGGGLGKDGKVPMAVGVWAADAVIGLAAVVLTFRLIKR